MAVAASATDISSMLNLIIKFSLTHRLLIVSVSLVTILVGAIVTSGLPIDVLPDLTRPRVVVITECHGYAPEEVERLVTFPLESAINGAIGVIAVRSSSGIGLSVINVEFDWGADIYIARQIVQERMATVVEQLPEDVQPQLGPISSLLGQILLIGMHSDGDETGPLELRTLGRLGGTSADPDDSRCFPSHHHGWRPETVSGAGRRAADVHL